VELPYLEELSFVDFSVDDKVAESISGLLDCPVLKTFKFDTWMIRPETYHSPNLLNWIHVQYPVVTCLSLICEVRKAGDLGREILEALLKPSVGGKWLFPCLNELHISMQREEDLSSLETLARARFIAEEISSLKAIVIRTALTHEDIVVDYGFIDQNSMDFCLKSLQIIVPSVVVKELRRPFEVDGNIRIL